MGNRLKTAFRAQKMNGRSTLRWRFRTERDVRKFWNQFREVPALARRTSRDEKRYCLALYFFVLATHSKLRYPLLVEEDASADFRIRSANQGMTLSVTKANQIWEAPDGNDGSDWLTKVQAAIDDKLGSIGNLSSASRHDLLVYQDTPVPPDQRIAGLAELRARLETQKKARIGRVSIIFSLDVELNTGRRFKNLEFIDWSNPNAFADFGERVEFEGRKAINTAIRDH
jgi:hypothetical protein